jgi:integrase
MITTDSTIAADIVVLWVPVHEIRSAHAEKHKAQRLAQGRANTTIKKELLLLGRSITYAQCAGVITKNLLTPVRGLPGADRSWIWLRLNQIENLLDCCSERIRPLIEFLILSGARIGEAQLIQKGDIRHDLSAISVPTEKRKRPPRECMRILKVAHLGPRFGALLSKLTPDPKTGLYFPLSKSIVDDDFAKAREKAGLDQLFEETGFHIHDLRGTFCVHRSMSGVAPRQLQYEVGHKNSMSLQSYLGRAEEFQPEDSIFFVPAAMPQVTSETSPSTPPNIASPGGFASQNGPASESLH